MCASCCTQALVIGKDTDDAALMLSFKRLELPEAHMLAHKQLVFEKAEETAEKVGTQGK